MMTEGLNETPVDSWEAAAKSWRDAAQEWKAKADELERQRDRLRDELRNFIASVDGADFGSGDIVLFNFEGLKALLAECEGKADG